MRVHRHVREWWEEEAPAAYRILVARAVGIKA